MTDETVAMTATAAAALDPRTTAPAGATRAAR